ncbi:hypothetical protein BDA99DRAFT_519299 [Phascolomyces articulosus]|uniref:Uncharacterized protein n=1 Tax=Phascolomyces articulosus TaxID=60185 RepID=A0AAD5JU48_9FUNG|nr:hypothetical protein BDA99DRAFT_519299 [Phascolomyces articulosus]
MKFLSSLAACVPLAALSIYYFEALPDVNDLPRTCEIYNVKQLTGINGFDTFLCIIVTIFNHAFRDPLGYDITWLLLGFFGLILTMFALEGSRTRSNRFLAWFSFWGMISNFGGMSNILLLLWIPAMFYCFDDSVIKDVRNVYISPQRANGILLAILLGYASPTAAMLLLDTLEMQKLGAMAWQFAPILVGILIVVFTPLMRCLEDPEDIRMTAEARAKLKVSDSRNAVQRVYMLIGMVNVIIYYGLYIRLKMEGMLSVETFINLLNVYNGQMTGVSVEQLGRIVATHIFAADLVICYLGCVIWALLDRGIKGALIMLLSSIVLGPAGGVALYCVYREEGLQDTTRLPAIHEKKTQ